MTETADKALSIQGEAMGDDVEYLYLTFGGPNAQTPKKQLAERGQVQRFVVHAKAVEDKALIRQDGEDRPTRKFKIVEVLEVGEIVQPDPEPEPESDPTFDDVSET